jgi:hypothetical protein
VPYSVKAVINNKEIKDHKNPDDSSSNKALILAFFLFTRVSHNPRAFDSDTGWFSVPVNSTMGTLEMSILFCCNREIGYTGNFQYALQSSWNGICLQWITT